jgi:FlaA1/EpsC-like NDP-sugar epimerase
VNSIRALIDRWFASRARSAPAITAAPASVWHLQRASIDIADLLGRPAVNLDTPELQRFLAGKRVMITGAGGSIGSEICRQSMKFLPQRVLLVERAEGALFEIDRELRQNWVGADIRPYVADICDRHRIEQIFQSEKPQVVFHAAAHKHVPMMEHNAGEAIKNNVFGTKTVADAALAFGASAFVMVSTDKAVNPSSVMGATKRFAELYVQSLNEGSGLQVQGSVSQKNAERWMLRAEERHSAQSSVLSPQSCSRPRFVAVRFGNVLGSSGSVVPIFQKQIEAGGPVTVTHPDMKRYFMTIPEASQLVMQAGAVAQGGEIFVLDMGQPMRILDLAQELIRRNGLRVNEDIFIEFTGVRPGEKLYEELSADNEQTCPTSHPKISVWQLPPADPREVAHGLEILAAAAQGTSSDAIAALSQCVPEYQPGGKSKDMPQFEDAPALRLIAPDAEAA